jgi:hypothetical protein
MIRTRIKGLVAIVIASAAIGGALAAPASAAQPLAHYALSCTIGGSPISASGTVSVGDAHQTIAFFRREVCDRGTLEYTVTKL